MCHIPPNLSVPELEYVELLIEIDSAIKTVELLALLNDLKDGKDDTLPEDSR